MSHPKIHVIGIGADGLGGISDQARELVAGAEVLVGGNRHLAMVDQGSAQRILWRSPIVATLVEIERHRSSRIVVLATADPLWHGIGRLLSDYFGADALAILPSVSSFQLTCSRLGWSLEKTLTVSLHGHPLVSLRRYLRRGIRLVLLTDRKSNPQAIASLVMSCGYGASIMHVFDQLGSGNERHQSGQVTDLQLLGLSHLTTVALDLVDGPVGASLSTGLPDDSYVHDGQLTKWETRAITIAALAPKPNELLWDIGAGAGSIAIEWLRSGPEMQAVAVEQRDGRVLNIQVNATILGVPGLTVLQGKAPDVSAGYSIT